MAHYSVASSYVSMILEFASLLGMSTGTLLQDVGIDGDQLSDSDYRVTARQYDDLFGRIADLTGFANFGLRCGQLIRPGHYGVVGYVVMNCHTFGEVLRQAERYQRLVGDVGHSMARQVGETVELCWLPNITPVHPQLVEQHVTAIVSYAWWITQSRNPPLSIHFSHPAPASIDEHERFFGCPVLFSQPFNGVTFPLSYIDMAIPQPDITMRELMTRHAENLLAQLSERNTYIDEIKAHLALRMAEAVPTLEGVAQHLDLHPRTLQRKLQDEGCTFKQLLDETRKEAAIHYINDAEVALPEIAFMLGFAEQAVFQRAFKRWTGQTPGRFRREKTSQRRLACPTPATPSDQSPAAAQNSNVHR